MDYIKKGLKISCILMFICGIIYPVAATGIGMILFPNKASGSIITYQGKEVGSALIGQRFDDPKYFMGRPSAYNYNMVEKGNKAVDSGSSNLGSTNKKLEERMHTDITTFLQKNPTVRLEDIPVDLLTESGSGLDPHISVKSALIQVPRIAKSTQISEEKLQEVIINNTENKFYKSLGIEGVNVLKANIAIQTLLDTK